MLKFLFFAFCFLASVIGQCLEIDEKLTLRILKISTSKKTILINRGLEDDLAVGDHAKFFTPSGVIARGVLEKVSPMRSVWSLYRLTKNDEIVTDKVINLKISSKLKLTKDSSKMIRPQDSEIITELPASKNTLKRSIVTPQEVSDRLAELEIMEKSLDIGFHTSPWAFWTLGSVNNLVGNYNEGGRGSVDSGQVFNGMTFGVEYYFYYTNWFKRFSFSLVFNYLNTLLQDISKEKYTHFLYGGRATYYHYDNPLAYHYPIIFYSVELKRGSAGVEFQWQTGTDWRRNLSGGGIIFSAGAGIKYAWANGWEGRTELDYLYSSMSFDPDLDLRDDITMTVSGFRLQFGLGYHF